MPHIGAGVWGEKYVEVVICWDLSYGGLFPNADVRQAGEGVLKTAYEVDLLQLVSVSCLIALEYKESIN